MPRTDALHPQLGFQIRPTEGMQETSLFRYVQHLLRRFVALGRFQIDMRFDRIRIIQITINLNLQVNVLGATSPHSLPTGSASL